MSRAYKTSLKKRTDYIYYTAEGTKIRITPSETGISETDIVAEEGVTEAAIRKM
jgi:hypothetical protein